MREAIPPLTQYAFMAWCLVKAQGEGVDCMHLPQERDQWWNSNEPSGSIKG